jgi:hypothetical protein
MRNKNLQAPDCVTLPCNNDDGFELTHCTYNLKICLDESFPAGYEHMQTNRQAGLMSCHIATLLHLQSPQGGRVQAGGGRVQLGQLQLMGLWQYWQEKHGKHVQCLPI